MWLNVEHLTCLQKASIRQWTSGEDQITQMMGKIILYVHIKKTAWNMSSKTTANHSLEWEKWSEVFKVEVNAGQGF